MEAMQAGSKIKTTSWMFGMLVILLQNQIYEITWSWKRGKVGVLHKK